MAAVALAESRGNPRARNPSGASGLWQILGLPFPGDPFDPLTNARMAVSKYGSQGLRAWEAYTNGNYRQFMARGGRLSSRGSMDWAGFRRAGGAFTTRSGRAAGFVAGEGGQREDVFIRPHRGRKRSALASSAAGGGGGRGVTVNVIFRAPVSVATKGDLDALTDSVAEKVGEKVRDALAAGDEVPDTVIG